MKDNSSLFVYQSLMVYEFNSINPNLIQIRKEIYQLKIHYSFHQPHSQKHTINLPHLYNIDFAPNSHNKIPTPTNKWFVSKFIAPPQGVLQELTPNKSNLRTHVQATILADHILRHMCVDVKVYHAWSGQCWGVGAGERRMRNRFREKEYAQVAGNVNQSLWCRGH